MLWSCRLNLTPLAPGPVWTALPPWGPGCRLPLKAAFQALFCAPTTEVLTDSRHHPNRMSKQALHPGAPCIHLLSKGLWLPAETPLSSSCSLWPLAPPSHAWPQGPACVSCTAEAPRHTPWLPRQDGAPAPPRAECKAWRPPGLELLPPVEPGIGRGSRERPLPSCSCPCPRRTPPAPAQHQGLDRPWVRHQACRHLASPRVAKRGPSPSAHSSSAAGKEAK